MTILKMGWRESPNISDFDFFYLHYLTIRLIKKIGIIIYFLLTFLSKVF